MKKYAYFNGEIILEDNVVISCSDLGFLRGYGIMDAMKTIKGKPFLLKEHFERLKNGAEAMNLNVDLDLRKFSGIVSNLLVKNKFNKDVAIKTVITGGESSNGLKIDGSPTVLITLNSLVTVSPLAELYEKGAKVMTMEFQRSMPKIKTTNYIFALQQQQAREEAKAIEIVYHHKGFVLEGATSNIFIVKDNKIITPSEDILMGTTRNFVIEILKKENIIVNIRKIKLEEILNADEIFITGTFKNVLPIVQVDDIIIGDGHVGAITKNIMKMVGDAIQ